MKIFSYILKKIGLYPYVRHTLGWLAFPLIYPFYHLNQISINREARELEEEREKILYSTPDLSKRNSTFIVRDQLLQVIFHASSAVPFTLVFVLTILYLKVDLNRLSPGEHQFLRWSIYAVVAVYLTAKFISVKKNNWQISSEGIQLYNPYGDRETIPWDTVEKVDFWLEIWSQNILPYSTYTVYLTTEKMVYSLRLHHGTPLCEVSSLFPQDQRSLHILRPAMREVLQKAIQSDEERSTLWNQWRSEHRDIELYLDNGYFYCQDLTGFDLSRALLRGAEFSRSHLEETNFTESHLEKADLSESHFLHTRFEGAHLEETNFTESNLYQTDFEKANLQDANFEGARLFEVNFSGVLNLTPQQLAQCNTFRQVKGLSDEFLEKVYELSKKLAHFESEDSLMALLRESTNDNMASWNHWRQENPEVEVDFSGADLEGECLTDGLFFDASFQEANLRGADLTRSNLTRAYLSHADLREARLEDANLHRADLSGVQWDGADLTRADLTEAELGSESSIQLEQLAQCQRITAVKGLSPQDIEELRRLHPKLMEWHQKGGRKMNQNYSREDLCYYRWNEVVLDRSNFFKAELEGISLRRASLQEVNFSHAYLSEADLSQGNLRGADFSEANLAEANLSQTNLEEVNFEGARLSRTILEGAKNLTAEQLSRCRLLDGVQGLSPEIIEELQELAPALAEGIGKK